MGERGGERDGRLTGGARLSSLTTIQMAGELTSGDAGHGGASGGQGRTQCRVAVRVVVEAVAGAVGFAGDEDARRRGVGRWLFRPFPTATERGKRGERVSEAWWFQIE